MRRAWTDFSPSRPRRGSRWMQMPNKDWQVRVRCGGDPFPGAHGMHMPKVKVNPATGEIEPKEYADWFSLYKGKRTTRQVCLSNPQVLDYVVNEVRERLK